MRWANQVCLTYTRTHKIKDQAVKSIRKNDKFGNNIRLTTNWYVWVNNNNNNIAIILQ